MESEDQTTIRIGRVIHHNHIRHRMPELDGIETEMNVAGTTVRVRVASPYTLDELNKTG